MSIEVTKIDPKQNPAGVHAVLIGVTGVEDMKRIKRVLDRSLNCDPEAGADLFEVADKLERLIRETEGA